MSIQNLLKFTEFINKFREVERLMLYKGSDRRENDSEHAFQLAIISWYIIENEKLPFSLEKVLKYCLAHDLVEIYAGDTPFFMADKTTTQSKAEKEHDAAQRISSEFPEFTNLHQIIQDYESRADEESKFVYALDKVVPVLNIYLDNGRCWEVDKISYDTLRTKDSKVKVSPIIEKYWLELVKLLEMDKEELFKFKEE